MISVTMLREMLDDIRRYRRDREVNSQLYKKLTGGGETFVPSSAIRVGDILIIEKVCPVVLFCCWPVPGSWLTIDFGLRIRECRLMSCSYVHQRNRGHASSVPISWTARRTGNSS